MFNVDGKINVIAPPMSGLTACRKMLEDAGHHTSLHGRHDLPPKDGGMTNVMLYRPFQGWLERVWHYRLALGDTWLEPWDKLEELHDDRYFSRITRRITGEWGCIEDMMRPLFELADYVVCSHWLESFGGILGEWLPRPRRTLSMRQENVPTPIWDPFAAQQWWETEPAINDFEFRLCGEARYCAVATARKWPVSVFTRLGAPDRPKKLEAKDLPYSVSALEKLDEMSYADFHGEKGRKAKEEMRAPTMRDTLERAGEWPKARGGHGWGV